VRKKDLEKNRHKSKQIGSKNAWTDVTIVARPYPKKGKRAWRKTDINQQR
jgi:hypothetical protein